MELEIRLMEQVLRRVLEEAAFVFAEPADTAPAVEGEVVLGSISFRGPARGELLFAVPAELAPELAANLLGTEPAAEDAVACATDSVGELANMVAGACLGAWFGVGEDYDLGAPSTRCLAGEAAEDILRQTQQRCLLLTDSGQRLELAITAEAR